MTVETRRNRLRSLFGAPETPCLQIFCIVSQSDISEEKFNRLAAKYGLNPNELTSAMHMPKPCIGEIEFRPGILIPKHDGGKYVSEANVQSVFTTLNAALIKQVKKHYENDDYVCLSNPFLDEVMSRYTNAIEERFPELVFEGKRYADVGHLSVEFQFGIQPYDFSIHSPRDMDVLKPITIIDGHVIEPSSTSDVSALKPIVA